MSAGSARASAATRSSELLPKLKAAGDGRKPLHRQERAAEGWPRSIGSTRAGGRDRVRRLHRRRPSAPGRVQGPARGQAGREVEAGEARAGWTTPLAEPASPTIRTSTVTPRGSAPVMGVTISHADKPLWPDARRRQAGHQARPRALLRSGRRLGCCRISGAGPARSSACPTASRRGAVLPAPRRQGPVQSHQRGDGLGRPQALPPVRPGRGAGRRGPGRRAGAASLEQRALPAGTAGAAGVRPRPGTGRAVRSA